MAAVAFSALVPSSGPFVLPLGIGKPAAALFFTAWNADATTTSTDATWSYGLWCRDSNSQAFTASGSDDNGVAGDGNIAGHTSGSDGVLSFVSDYGSGVPAAKTVWVTGTSNSGLTLDYDISVSGLRIYGIAFGGKTADARIVTYQTPTDGSSVDMTGTLPWPPIGLIDIQAPVQPDDQDGSAIFGLGMADNHGNQWLTGANATWLNQRNETLYSDEAFSAGWTDGAYSYAAGDGGIYAVTVASDGFTLDAINGGSSATPITHYTLALFDSDPTADFTVGTVTNTEGSQSVTVGYQPDVIAGTRTTTANGYEGNPNPGWHQFGVADPTRNHWAWWANWWPNGTTDIHGNKQSGSLDADTNLTTAVSGFLSATILSADLAGGGITATGFDVDLETDLAGFKFGWMTAKTSPASRFVPQIYRRLPL